MLRRWCNHQKRQSNTFPYLIAPIRLVPLNQMICDHVLVITFSRLWIQIRVLELDRGDAPKRSVSRSKSSFHTGCLIDPLRAIYVRSVENRQKSQLEIEPLNEKWTHAPKCRYSKQRQIEFPFAFEFSVQLQSNLQTYPFASVSNEIHFTSCNVEEQRYYFFVK